MSSIRIILFIALPALLALIGSSLHVQAQGSFTNLDFDSANLTSYTSGQPGLFVPATDALPGWTVYLGNSQQSQVLYNSLTTGAASVGVSGDNFTISGTLYGEFEVVLEPGNQTSSGGPNVSASISQTGLVPATAASLEFSANISTPFTVSLGGQNLNVALLDSGYGANIPSGDAGQVETLTVTALAGPAFTDYFDSFAFSSSPVPEPGIWTLILLGAVAIRQGERSRRFR